MPLVLFMVIDDNADDSGIVLCKQNLCHIWHITPLLNQFLNPSHCLV